MKESSRGERDELDQLIARYLLSNPEAVTIEIASALGKSALGRSEHTVQRRVAKMTEDGVIVQKREINDWAAIGYPFRYRIDVRVDQEALREPPSYGAPHGEEPREPVDNWRRLAQYIMKDLIPYLEEIPASKTVSKRRFSRDDLLLENVTILLGQETDLSVTVRARTPDAVLSFVVDGLRTMRGVSSTDRKSVV